MLTASHRVAPTPEGKALGERIRVLRVRADMTQQELGDHIGLGRTAICNMEKGRQPLTGRNGVVMARALGVSVEVLYGEKPDEVPTTDAAVILADLGVLEAKLRGLGGQVAELLAEVRRAKDYLRQETRKGART